MIIFQSLICTMDRSFKFTRSRLERFPLALVQQTTQWSSSTAVLNLVAQQGVGNSISGLILKTKIGYLFSISDKIEAKIDYVFVTANHFSIWIVTLFVENQLLLRGIWLLKYNLVESNEPVVSSFEISRSSLFSLLTRSTPFPWSLLCFHIAIDVCQVKDSLCYSWCHVFIFNIGILMNWK